MPNLIKEHKTLEQFGSCIYQEIQGQYLYLESLSSLQKGSGFGTRAYRLLMKKSLELGYDGNLLTQACWSSHLFHIYMGMIPIDSQVLYLSATYGYMHRKILDSLTKLQECETVNDISILEQDILYHIKFLFSHELRQKMSLITSFMILEQKNFLLSFQGKKASNIQAEIIPELIGVLQNNVGKRYPDTSNYFGSVTMTMSQEGKKRWFLAITYNKKFTPFKNFEHLRPYMTYCQREQLDSLITKHNLMHCMQEIKGRFHRSYNCAGGFFGNRLSGNANCENEIHLQRSSADDVSSYKNTL